MRFIASLFIVPILVIACQFDKNQDPEVSLLYDQVIEIHDEVMPKMRDIRQLKKKLTSISSAEQNKDVKLALQQLEDAHDAMMDWMAQFKMPKNVEKSQSMDYLRGQMVSVNDMKAKMLDAIENANELNRQLNLENQ